jgi:hypothetical protein
MARYDRSAYLGPRSIPLTIASGQPTSDVIDRPFESYLAILFPAAMTGTKFSFLASTTIDGEFVRVTDEAKTLIAHDIELSSWVTLPATTLARLAAFRYIKIKSNANEADDREIQAALSEG